MNPCWCISRQNCMFPAFSSISWAFLMPSGASSASGVSRTTQPESCAWLLTLSHHSYCSYCSYCLFLWSGPHCLPRLFHVPSDSHVYVSFQLPWVLWCILLKYKRCFLLVHSAVQILTMSCTSYLMEFFLVTFLHLPGFWTFHPLEPSFIIPKLPDIFQDLWNFQHLETLPYHFLSLPEALNFLDPFITLRKFWRTFQDLSAFWK